MPDKITNTGMRIANITFLLVESDPSSPPTDIPSSRFASIWYEKSVELGCTKSTDMGEVAIEASHCTVPFTEANLIPANSPATNKVTARMRRVSKEKTKGGFLGCVPSGLVCAEDDCNDTVFCHGE